MSILKVANVHFDAAGTNRIDYLGDDKVRITSANGTVLSGSTADSLLRITQTGTGHAIRVEDSTNPDDSAFIVTANGQTILGANASINGAYQTGKGVLQIHQSISENLDNDDDTYGLHCFNWSNSNVNYFDQYFLKSRGNTVGEHVAVQNGDGLMWIMATGSNGSTFAGTSVGIYGEVDGVPAEKSVPGSLSFWTTASGDQFVTERMRITATGNVLIGRTDSIVGLGVKLDVNGSINCSNIFVNGNVVSGGGSVTVTDQSSVTPLQYLTFTTTTTGTASSINVASTKLTFNVDTGTLSSTVFNSTSDINKKTNITQITDAVTLVNSLNGVRFDWKDNGLPSLGVIAQEVEKVLPELVSDEKSVNYNGLIAVLIEAVKDLSKRVEELENR